MRFIVTTENIEVEVAYARPDKQVILKVTGVQGITALQAVECSGIKELFPEIDPATVKMGVFGKATKPDAELQPGDRVEIYRPLIADPKQARKKKAAKEKAAKETGEEKAETKAETGS
jgi:putative ubiquitin-RnfH superfamily antitoxin RatB of RatAB toxin-antitoxin module